MFRNRSHLGKLITLGLLCSLGTLEIWSQEIKGIDQSALDFAVFRPDGQGTHPVARIIYSRPAKKGRKIFGELVPYKKIWRTGANQSTELNIYRDLYIQEEKLPAGNYTLYTIPQEDAWTFIISNQLFTWGDYDYDPTKDVMRFEVPAKISDEEREHFGMAFGGEEGQGKLLLAWDRTEVLVPFTY